MDNKRQINPRLVKMFKEYDIHDDEEAIKRVEALCRDYVKLCGAYIKDDDVVHCKTLKALLFDNEMNEVMIAMMASGVVQYEQWKGNKAQIKMMHNEIIGLVNKITRLQQDNKVLKNLCGNKLKGGG